MSYNSWQIGGQGHGRERSGMLMLGGIGERVSMYITVDGSGSMHGEKADSVRNSVLEIIGNTPDDTEYTIRAFNQCVRLLTNATPKRALDLNNIAGALYTGGGTALYDAIGDTIEGIPNNAFLGKVYILIFTDGEEYNSRRLNLDQVVAMIERVAKRGNVSFTFIQAGPPSQIFRRLTELQNQLPDNVSVFSVADSGSGIKIGFEAVQNQWRLAAAASGPYY